MPITVDDRFLGGIDAQNSAVPTMGFINESSVADPRLIPSRLTVDGSGRKVPLKKHRG